MLIKCKRREHGATLVEPLVALAIGGIVVAALASVTYSTSTNLARMIHYVEMATDSQTAADQLTRDARRANRVTNIGANSLTFEDSDGGTLSYDYSNSNHTLTRTKNGSSLVLLRGCDAFTLTPGRRNPTGAFEDFPAAPAAECKVISVTWQCSRLILGRLRTSQHLVSAKIVIRRQGT
jgi:Tfp pilus assembly protein PilW